MNREKTLKLLESTFRSAVEFCVASDRTYYDLFVTMDFTEGKVTISDDEENLLAEETLFAYAQSDEPHCNNAPCSEAEFVKLLRTLLEDLGKTNLFEVGFGEPFSITYLSTVNEDSNEELLYRYNDQSLVETPLLQHMDEELDAFFQSLLSTK